MKLPDHWPDLALRDTDPEAYAEAYMNAFMRRPLQEGEPFAKLVDSMTDEQADALVDSWVDPARPMSKHLELAIAAALHRRRRNLPPLRDGEPVPGCACPDCTGLPADAPARVVPLKARLRRAAHGNPLDVETARSVPILEVARRLGLEPVRQGREWVARCPLHEDRRPSLRLDAKKGVWFCHPCSEGGDGIRLFQRARGIGFPDAVRELAA
jgi:hypothetical protein